MVSTTLVEAFDHYNVIDRLCVVRPVFPPLADFRYRSASEKHYSCPLLRFIDWLAGGDFHAAAYF